ncbi:hypothetical protein Htur_4938 (plasmid) [Haloterrigena turkmenica DSM 5511]|uniref:Uncharacterized protein n=1 Tax=Haloterrigena turkmenica (strain ATCC 51198 / DSM 5511 / JCM 9101 / NCIMB 13204 / VKM B-1734 / 4k) TaxID=543526 RepID=D2S2S7_HALTV|nr:hypothetical protein [Haloterrigena turkmenica]ADB63674.1 hypothetical protein Htur_4938 [Haloterrigena turkmenica DSM 5511]
MQRPSGHRIRQPHADRINAAYETGYTKCPCKTDNAVICAGPTVPADVPFDPDTVTIEETDSEELLDPDALPTLPCSLGAEGLFPSWSVDAVATLIGKVECRQHPTNILRIQ